jgi:hypothetical protein
MGQSGRGGDADMSPFSTFEPSTKSGEDHAPFGERVNIFDAAPPNVSLNKEEMGEETFSLKPLSPKSFMNRNCTGADTLSIIVLMMALCLSLQTHQCDTYTIHQGYKKHQVSPGKTTFSGIAARFTTPSLRFFNLFLWDSSPPPRSPQYTSS